MQEKTVTYGKWTVQIVACTSMTSASIVIYCRILHDLQHCATANYKGAQLALFLPTSRYPVHIAVNFKAYENMELGMANHILQNFKPFARKAVS